MKKKILIVDDEPHMRKLAAYSLKKGGYDFVFAEDGNEVQGITLYERPDLIILDVRMANMDGLAALRILRAHSDSVLIPVIMLTGMGNMSTGQAGYTGANALMMKPYSPTELFQTAKNLLAA